MNKDLLLEVKTYIEENEVLIDSEWGSGNELETLIAKNKMPELYTKICDLLKE